MIFSMLGGFWTRSGQIEFAVGFRVDVDSRYSRASSARCELGEADLRAPVDERALP